MVSTILVRVLLVLSTKLFPPAFHTALVTSMLGTDQLNTSTPILFLGELQLLLLSYQTCPSTLPTLRYVLRLVTTINDGPDAIPYFGMEHNTLNTLAEVEDSIWPLPVQRSQPTLPITQSHHMAIGDPPLRYDAMSKIKSTLYFKYCHHLLGLLSPPKVVTLSVWDVLSVVLVSLLCRGCFVLTRMFWNLHFAHNALYGPGICIAQPIPAPAARRIQMPTGMRRSSPCNLGTSYLPTRSNVVLSRSYNNPGSSSRTGVRSRVRAPGIRIRWIIGQIPSQTKSMQDTVRSLKWVSNLAGLIGHWVFFWRICYLKIRQAPFSNGRNATEVKKECAKSGAKGLESKRLGTA